MRFAALPRFVRRRALLRPTGPGFITGRRDNELIQSSRLARARPGCLALSGSFFAGGTRGTVPAECGVSQIRIRGRTREMERGGMVIAV